jgi:hypothetical protein
VEQYSARWAVGIDIRHQVAPSQLDIVSMCREALYTAGVFPSVRFCHAVDEKRDESENPMPLAA